MKLIDADYLIDTIGAMIGYGTTPTDIWDMVNDAPTIDAVSVVRCKECKHAHMTYGGECKYCDMWKDDDDFCLELYLDGDFYCADGERKEGE